MQITGQAVKKMGSVIVLQRETAKPTLITTTTHPTGFKR